jgi:hypothetical protein
MHTFDGPNTPVGKSQSVTKGYSKHIPEEVLLDAASLNFGAFDPTI